MNLPQARAVVKLLEDVGEDAWATVKRPADINSLAYEVTVHGDQVKPVGQWELQKSGEAVPIDE